MKSTIKPGDVFCDLTAQWTYKKKEDRVWKCTCKCGGYCYVKEKALIQKVAKNCEKCEENKKKIAELANINNYIGPMWLRRPETENETMQPESGAASY